MKFSLNQQDIQKSLNYCQGVIEKRSTLPILSNVLLDVGNGSIDGESFELGNGKNYSINELVDAFGDYPREHIPARPGEMRETLNTDTKAQEILGWEPKGDIIDYIKKTWSQNEE